MLNVSMCPCAAWVRTLHDVASRDVVRAWHSYMTLMIRFEYMTYVVSVSCEYTRLLHDISSEYMTHSVSRLAWHKSWVYDIRWHVLWVHGMSCGSWDILWLHATPTWHVLWVHNMCCEDTTYVVGAGHSYRGVPGSRNHGFWPSQRVSKHTLMKSATQPASVVSINH